MIWPFAPQVVRSDALEAGAHQLRKLIVGCRIALFDPAPQGR